MNGFEKELRSKILGFTSHATIYTKKDIFDNKDMVFKKLEGVNEIIGYSPYIQKEGLLSSKHSTKTIFLRAVNPSMEKTVSDIHENMVVGEFNDFKKIKNSVIIGTGVAQKLFVSIGDEVELLTLIKLKNINIKL